MFDLLIDDLPLTLEVKGLLQPVKIDTSARAALMALREYASDDRLPAVKRARILGIMVRRPERFLSDDKLSDAVLAAVLEYLFQITPQEAAASGDSSSEKVFDWEEDSKLVVAAMRQIYGLDLDSIRHMHWWEFKALFDALLHEDTALGRVIRLRAEKPSPGSTPQERIALRKRQNAVRLKGSGGKGKVAADGKKVVSEAFSSL